MTVVNVTEISPNGMQCLRFKWNTSTLIWTISTPHYLFTVLRGGVEEISLIAGYNRLNWLYLDYFLYSVNHLPHLMCDVEYVVMHNFSLCP